MLAKLRVPLGMVRKALTFKVPGCKKGSTFSDVIGGSCHRVLRHREAYKRNEKQGRRWAAVAGDMALDV
jgi:hypothetical protein